MVYILKYYERKKAHSNLRVKQCQNVVLIPEDSGPDDGTAEWARVDGAHNCPTAFGLEHSHGRYPYLELCDNFRSCNILYG